MLRGRPTRGTRREVPGTDETPIDRGVPPPPAPPATRAWDYPGTWILIIAIGLGLAMTAAGQGWIVSLILLVIVLAVVLARCADAAKTRFHARRGLIVFLVPTFAVLLVSGALVLGGFRMAQALRESTVAAQVDQGKQRPDMYRAWMKNVPFLKHQPSAQESLAKGIQAALTVTGGILSRVMTGVNGAVMALGVLLVSALIALHPGRYYAILVGLFPPTHRARLHPMMQAVGERLERWAIARMISAAELAVITAAGLLVVGTPWAIGLGLFTGLFSFIPVIGTIVAGLLAFLIVIVTQQGHPLAVLIVLIVANLIDGYVVWPFLMRRAVNTPAGLTLGSILIMGTIGGLPGLLIAGPLVLAITTVAEMQTAANDTASPALTHDLPPA